MARQNVLTVCGTLALDGGQSSLSPSIACITRTPIEKAIRPATGKNTNNEQQKYRVSDLSLKVRMVLNGGKDKYLEEGYAHLKKKHLSFQ
jgi:hypothetical protein